MKKIALLLSVVLLLCGLCGCFSQNRETEPPTLPIGKPITPAKPGATEPTPDQSQPAEVTEPTSEEDGSSYTVEIPIPDQSIFDAPSYDGRFVGVVEKAGVYTIVEEATDDEGNLWGRLKSGKGWVDLTQIRELLQHPQPLRVNFADTTLLSEGDYYSFQQKDDPYMLRVAFRAGRTLSDFSLCSVTFADQGFQPDVTVYTLQELTREKALVADLSFPGDMSAYAVLFTDESGTQYRYLLTVSGRNGTLVFEPF